MVIWRELRTRYQPLYVKILLTSSTSLSLMLIIMIQSLLLYTMMGPSIGLRNLMSYFTDPEYLKILHYSWIEGNSDALQKEKTAVLTASLAKKYFGNESALNKVFNFNNQFDVTVTGVVADPPLNTDFPFRMILSSRLGKDKRGWDGWGAMSRVLTAW